MEIKNNLTVTRGRGRVKSRNMYKGPIEKDNRAGGRIACGRWGLGRAGESKGGMGTTVTEQQ